MPPLQSTLLCLLFCFFVSTFTRIPFFTRPRPLTRIAYHKKRTRSTLIQTCIIRTSATVSMILLLETVSTLNLMQLEIIGYNAKEVRFILQDFASNLGESRHSTQPPASSKHSPRLACDPSRPPRYNTPSQTNQFYQHPSQYHNTLRSHNTHLQILSCSPSCIAAELLRNPGSHRDLPRKEFLDSSLRSCSLSWRPSGTTLQPGRNPVRDRSDRVRRSIRLFSLCL